MHRRRRGSRGRFPIQPHIECHPRVRRLIPDPQIDSRPIHLDLAEVEALRLIDLEGLYQEQAGMAMGLSRGTIWRLLMTARRKVVQSLIEGRPLVIGHGQEDTEPSLKK